MTTYNFSRILDRITAQSIARHLDEGADDNTSEKPGAVFEEGQEGDPEEDDTVEDRRNDREGEGRVVWLHGLRGVDVCHFVSVW